AGAELCAVGGGGLGSGQEHLDGHLLQLWLPLGHAGRAIGAVCIVSTGVGMVGTVRGGSRSCALWSGCDAEVDGARAATAQQLGQPIAADHTAEQVISAGKHRQRLLSIRLCAGRSPLVRTPAMTERLVCWR